MENQPNKWKKGCMIAAAVLGLIIFLTVALFPPYQTIATSGQFNVGTIRNNYTDESQFDEFATGHEKRQVSVSFWFPEDEDGVSTYPLIVFSHGGLGLETSNESLFLELASHGFVVASIGHTYHAFWTKGEDGRTTYVNMEYFRDLQQEDAQNDKEQSYRFYQSWMATRTADINFVIDKILTNAANDAGGVYALINPAKIGLMGHSLGGSAVLAVPRQRNDIAVVIALESPFLYDIVGVKNNEFEFLDEIYPVPVLNIYSDSSWDHLSEWPQYARNFALLSEDSHIVHNLYLSGAGHFSLTDLALTSPILVGLLEGEWPNLDGRQYLQKVNQPCLEFFNRYLKDFEDAF